MSVYANMFSSRRNRAAYQSQSLLLDLHRGVDLSTGSGVGHFVVSVCGHYDGLVLCVFGGLTNRALCLLHDGQNSIFRYVKVAGKVWI